jgi:uncharacterized damage-inducible protein DinB
MNEVTSVELNWRPSATSNSIGNIFKHILGAELFWIHGIIGGIDVHRNRDSEFRLENFHLSDLLNLQEEVRETSQKVLDGLRNRDLDRIRQYWSDKHQSVNRSTIHQCLIRTTTHSARHLGQICYLWKLLSEGPPQSRGIHQNGFQGIH